MRTLQHGPIRILCRWSQLHRVCTKTTPEINLQFGTLLSYPDRDREVYMYTAKVSTKVVHAIPNAT